MREKDRDAGMRMARKRIKPQWTGNVTQRKPEGGEG